jgi:hypothetical protein
MMMMTTTTTTTQHMGTAKTKIVPVIIRTTGNVSKSFRKYLSNIRETTPINYRKVIVGTAHILRQVLV